MFCFDKHYVCLGGGVCDEQLVYMARAPYCGAGDKMLQRDVRSRSGVYFQEQQILVDRD